MLLRRPFDRRSFLCGSAQSAASLALGLNGISHAAESPDPLPRAGDPLDDNLGHFVVQYMQAMFAPGLTLSLVHPDGRTSAACFGLSDVERREPVTPAMLFQIGSISKSFCALALLQMQDEGKVDLERPILDYLPWLPIDAPLGTITVHHLLTHTAGLPDDTPLFQPDRNARIQQTFKPGSQFHYCNLGFTILGHLAASLDRTSYASVLQRRLLTPLGMKDTVPAISGAILDRECRSYNIRRSDLSAGRDAALGVAPRSVFTSAAGCVASTPADMARYMTMLLHRGELDHTRILSEKAFAQFRAPYIAAAEFGEGAHYGYGIAIASVNGHTVLRHTGGMDSFASSMQVDLDGHMAAFASINAMQGYRPNPVTLYALEVMRAKAEKRAAAAPEALPDPAVIRNAAEYAGLYTGPHGGLRIVAEDNRLVAEVGATRVPLVHGGGDSFFATVPRWQEFAWSFSRANGSIADGAEAGAHATRGRQGEPPAVTELSYGPRWYCTAAYKGPREFPRPPHLLPFEGAYDSGTESTHVYLLKGALTLDGTPLTELGGGLFRPADEPNSPETAEFLHVVDGRARLLLFDGSVLPRVETT